MALGLWEKKTKEMYFSSLSLKVISFVLFPQASVPSLNFNLLTLLIGAKLLWFHLSIFFLKSPYYSLYLRSVAWELGILQQVNFAWLGKWCYVFKEGNQLFKNVWEQFFITSSNGKNVTFISFSKSISLPHRRNETLVTPVCETVPKS